MVGWTINAQTTTIKGQILDESKQQGVPFALVKINNQYTYADDKGFFEAQVNPSESFSLQLVSSALKRQRLLTYPTN